MQGLPAHPAEAKALHAATALYADLKVIRRTGGSMRHLQAYAAAGFAYDRGEPAQPPATIPSHRKDAWLKGWADQKTFIERQATGRKQSRGPAEHARQPARRHVR